MMYGMSYDEFWNGDPWLAVYYREAYRIRRKEENYRDYLQGAYIYNALSIALGNAFRRRGSKVMNYFDEEPFQIFPLTKEEKAAKLEKEKRAMEEQMLQLMAQQHAKMKSSQEQQDGTTGKT